MNDTTDTPTTTSWSQDWQRASEAAAAYNASKASQESGNEEQQERGGSEEAADNQASGNEGAAASGQGAQLGEESSGREGADAAEREDPLDGGNVGQESRSDEEVDDSKPVAVAERVAFRKERRALKEKLAAQESQLTERLEQATIALEQKYQTAMNLQRALDEGDFDAIAKVAGYEDFGRMSVAAVETRMSPREREVMKLKRDLLEERRQREAGQKAAQERRAKEEAAQRVQDYKEELQDELRSLGDEAIADFANEASFVDMVYAVQQKNWDGSTTIASDEAARLVITELRKSYERMHKRFGSQTPRKSEIQSASETHVAEKPRRKPPRTVSQTEAADVSGSAPETELDEAAWLRKWGPAVKSATYD